MRINNLIALGALAAVQAARYNILSLDAAKYKGYMTAQFISYLEKYAYNVARRDICIPKRESGRVAMPELFDMISGSETGAIIATTITLPNTDPATSAIQKNRFFADRAVRFFEENVDTLYRDSQMGWFPKLVIIVAAILILGSFSYWATYKLFQVSDFDERVTELTTLIKLRKRAIKKNGCLNPTDEEILQQTIEKIQAFINKTFKNLNPTSFAANQRRRLDDIYHKCERVYNKDDLDISIKGIKINQEEQDEEIDENDKIMLRLIRVEEELQQIKIDQQRR